MIFLDTSYFFAVLQPRDSLHARALAWSDALDGPLLTTDYVLWETVNSLSAPHERSKIHTFLDFIFDSPEYEILPANSRLQSAGLKLHAERPDKAWSLTDCISFVVMEERGLKRALTHDHHFEQAGYEALLRADPPN
jgi:uncharacterized protein